jgi:hypothetical protein
MDQPRGRNMRLVALGTVLIALTAGYLLLLRNFNVPELPSERHFGAADPVVPAGEVYLASTPSTTRCRCAPICRQACRKAKTLRSPRTAI